ncbi:hypothetical protein CMQ_5234 [Grosmannia clavigera kw1407]|uniref:Uncharacterized protein n=1 Tax=Grosmannia clavigera (strain kw1407 / UAMH 11150) TaxID=655863 RepID=F0XBU7_GROCL|nr:uncharacterized protein CMQ_5234 [Grosmannia clavigera kw1407]EFX04972.1 hypothetical protein CMQ_5234 [Grosmannia clavigera kw1407]
MPAFILVTRPAKRGDSCAAEPQTRQPTTQHRTKAMRLELVSITPPLLPKWAGQFGKQPTRHSVTFPAA